MIQTLKTVLNVNYPANDSGHASTPALTIKMALATRVNAATVKYKSHYLVIAGKPPWCSLAIKLLIRIRKFQVKSWSAEKFVKSHCRIALTYALQYATLAVA